MKKLLYLLICLALTLNGTYAQTYKGKVYTVAEQPPQYPGGPVALSRYLAATIKVPGSVGKQSIPPGSVAAKFVVDELGYIHDIRVTTLPFEKKGKKGMERLIINVIQSIERMPRWNPGEVKGEKVAVFYTMPIDINM